MPAVSIVFFSVGSGAGLGLLAWITLIDLFASEALSPQVQWRAATLGLVLLAAGLASSVLHLARPQNAWRALSRFRTSWLSREAILATVLFPVAATYIVLTATRSGGAWRSAEIAWRALSRFRTSLLSREAILATVLFPVAATYIVLTATRSGGAWRSA